MLGFPIRTPPDHSLVANSPGLIAGSNVLHRLLMPRHPPCALHSLSQQRQNNTHPNAANTRHKRQTTNPHHNQGKGPASHFDTASQGIADHANKLIKRIALDNTTNNTPTPTHTGNQDPSVASPDARVHYADLKQQPHQPPPPTTAGDKRRRNQNNHPAPAPPTRGGSQPADSSGPNSVLDPVPHQREATSNHHSTQQAGTRA